MIRFLISLLSREGRLAYAIRRAGKTLTERYAQPDARERAAERLLEIGTPEAVYQLARRFTMTAGNLEQDDYEKRWMRDQLVKVGENAVAPLRRFIAGHDDITWAMEALRELMPAEELTAFLFEVLADGDPVAIRGPKAVRILEFLASVEADPAGLARCLDSSDDTVRIATVRALAERRDPATRETLLEAFVSANENSTRVRIAIAEVFADLEWEVRGHRREAERVLPDGFRITSRGRVIRTASPE